MVSNVGFSAAPNAFGAGFRHARPQDLNGDGKIDFNEFSAAKRQHFMQKTGGTGQLQLSQVKAKLDQGVQVGKLSALEAQAILAKLSQKDLNKDGIIDANEFEQGIKQKFAARDTNNDGAIDANEQAIARQARMQKRLAKLNAFNQGNVAAAPAGYAPQGLVAGGGLPVQA